MKSKYLKNALVSAMVLASSSVIADSTNVAAKASHAQVLTQKISGIDTQYVDSSVNAKDDFYDHVNGLWLKNTDIPSDKSAWGAFYILREQSINQLHDIVNDLSHKQVVKGSAEQKVATLYANFMDEKTINDLGIKPLQPELDRIEQIKSKTDLAKIAAHNSRIGVNSPLNVGIMQDLKDSTKMIAAMGQSGLGLPDRDYYLKDDKKFVEVRSRYIEYIEKTLSLSGDKDALNHAKNILKLESEIAKNQWTNVQNRDIPKTYNIYKLEDLKKLTPNFDWSTYIQDMGLNGKINHIMVAQPSYFQGLTTVINQTDLDTWKAYFKFHLVSGYSPLLSQNFVDNSFNFYSKTLRDIKEQKPRWKRGVELVDGNLGESLGEIYVEKYFPPEQKQRMVVLVQNLIKAYDQSIDQLDWMSPKTKVEARKKLSSMMVKIGYPNKWRDYSALDIRENDLIGNVLRSHEFEHQYELNKLGKPVDREEWGMTPQTVNAYFNPSLNEIVFPAAILQPPFFNMDADDAVNYGGIGAVIGHEISHSFDDQGSQFDNLGNMKNWWTKEDHQKFTAKTKALIEQYNRYEPIPGYHVNGELTLGENIADNSGLSIAYKAYKISLNGKPAPIMDGLTGDQRFYTGWAQVWRAKMREGQALEYLKTDPHSPAKVRGNATLVNQDPFYDAFKIKEGDKMYLAPEKRVHIW